VFLGHAFCHLNRAHQAFRVSDFRHMNLDEQLDTFLRKPPTLGQHVFVAPGAVVIGDVTLGDQASVWFNAVLRGDINRIQIGCRTNVQDNAVFHLADELPCIVGENVTVGHGAILHACTVEDECLIGMGSTVLDGAVIGRHSIVGARALVPRGMRVPPGSLVMGVPARIVRALSEAEREEFKRIAAKYVALAEYYQRQGIVRSQKIGAAEK
jgi:gamma-carbonic anhydrase